MISLTQLAERGLISHEVARVIRTQDGLFSAGEVFFSREQAAAIVAVGEFHAHWKTLGRSDLLALYKRLRRVFESPPPTMTYDIVLSRRMKLQLIPRQYLAQIDITFVGAA